MQLLWFQLEEKAQSIQLYAVNRILHILLLFISIYLVYIFWFHDSAP